MSFFKLLLCLLISIFIVSGCSYKQSRVSYDKTICDKSEAITQAKTLLQIEDLYFFDCDFSNLQSIQIEGVSYNLCVSGYYQHANNVRVLNLDKQADIKIVSNYKLNSMGTCFGFSVIASVLIPKCDHYINNKYDYTNPNIIYGEDTYNNIKNLHNNGETIYQGNSNTLEIAVPANFYPITSFGKAVSVESNYIKIEGDIYSSAPIKIIDTPISITTHYKSYNDKNAEQENSTIDLLIDYFTNNAVYTKF